MQIIYGTRRTDGIGLTDGERIERLWSYLGGFANISEEMSPENRCDLLTDALIHYGRKVHVFKICINFFLKMEVSFNGGWQKRGTGWNYNSNTGENFSGFFYLYEKKKDVVLLLNQDIYSL